MIRSCYNQVSRIDPVSGRRPWLPLLAATLIFAVQAPERTCAEVVQLKMTGEISMNSFSGALPNGIYEGAPFEIHLSYDTKTPEHPLFIDDPQRGHYPTDEGPDNFLFFRAGPAELHASDLSLLVGNDIPELPTSIEEWGASGRPLWDLEGDSFQMRTSHFTANFPITIFNQIGFRWANPERDAFNSDALPTHLNLAQFDDTSFQVFVTSMNPTVDRFIFHANVTNVVRVPEPATSQIVTALVCALILTTFRPVRQMYRRAT